MASPWIAILNNLQLSRTEKEVVKRFEADPEGRAFLPVADILRSHRLQDECLELLTEGVGRHPTFTVARVVLARELLQKGLVTEAARTLDESPLSLKDNILAQKLHFRIAVLMGQEYLARSLYGNLKLQQMVDHETRALGDILEVSGFPKAREVILREYSDRSITLQLPETKPVSESPEEAAAMDLAGGVVSLPDEYTLPKITRSEYFTDEDVHGRDLEGFHVVALGEIFRPGDGGGGAVRGRPTDGIELDSTTLAEIYEKQGHYSKALDIYRRLLRMSPNNDLLKRKVSEMARLDKEQKDVDLTVDPSLVDKMETIEIIDRQIKFYNDLLGMLDG
jgi:tetratricopeptide (TPR) repeat protein